MSAIRVLMTDLPQLMRDIVLTLAQAEHELVIAGYRQTGEDDRAAVQRTQADVILRVGSGNGDAERAESLLRANPRLRVLTISADGRRVRLERLVISVVELEDLSPANLVDALLGRAEFGNGAGSSGHLDGSR